MAEGVATIQLDDGSEYATGLLLPSDDEMLLMNSMPIYPGDLMLDTGDIKRLLDGDRYLHMRQKYRKWVQNQANQGSCNSNAVTGAVHQLREEQGMPHVPLSWNHIYSRMNGGQDRGSALINAFKLAQSEGIAPQMVDVGGRQVEMPLYFYNRREVDRRLLAAADEEAMRFRGFEWYRAPENFSDFKVAVASALAMDLPVVFAWHVGKSSSRLRNGYVQLGSGRGNHATYFQSGKYVGGSDIVHPDMKNSWGPSMDKLYGTPRNSGWGEQGSALFTMEQAYSCNRWHYTYIGTTVRPDPKNLLLSR